MGALKAMVPSPPHLHTPTTPSFHLAVQELSLLISGSVLSVGQRVVLPVRVLPEPLGGEQG